MKTTNDNTIICNDCGAHMKPKLKWLGHKMSFWVCPFCNGRNRIENNVKIIIDIPQKLNPKNINSLNLSSETFRGE